MKSLAVIRIRGEANIRTDIKQTLHMLRLYKKHNCIIVPDTANYVGMLNKVKDYVTWGELNEATLKLLLEKRARLVGKQKLTEDYLKHSVKINMDELTKEVFVGNKKLKDIPGLKPFFKLRPPMHGFEKEGIKKPYSLGGALGYRKDSINELLRRMI